MQLQSYDLIGIMEAWWDSSCDWMLTRIDALYEGQDEKERKRSHPVGRCGALPRDG